MSRRKTSVSTKREKIFFRKPFLLLLGGIFFFVGIWFVISGKFYNNGQTVDELEKSVRYPSFAAYENLTVGFSFLYPEGYEVVEENNEIIVRSPQQKGVVIISLENDSYTYNIQGEKLSDTELKQLNSVKELISDTFRIVDRAQEISTDHKRFAPTKASKKVSPMSESN